jgi:hypothetical protein
LFLPVGSWPTGIKCFPVVVANADDSRVVLGTAFDDDVITPSSSSPT